MGAEVRVRHRVIARGAGGPGAGRAQYIYRNTIIIVYNI